MNFNIGLNLIKFAAAIYIISIFLFFLINSAKRIKLSNRIGMAVFISTVTNTLACVVLFFFTPLNPQTTGKRHYLIYLIVVGVVTYVIKRIFIKFKFQIKIYPLILSWTGFIASMLVLGSHWLIHIFGDVNVDQIVYTLANAEGTDTTNIYTFINNVLIPSILISILFYFILHFIYKINVISLHKRTSRFIQVMMVLLLLIASTTYGLKHFGWSKIVNYFSDSTFIRKNIVNTKDTTVSFSGEKRNLIYIFVESLETSYASKDQGGDQSVNLLKPLMDVDPNSINFSNTQKFGGQQQLPGMDYTAAGIIAQTSGLPLKFGGNYTQDDVRENFGGKQIKNMLPGLKSLGEILKENGYTNYFLMGSTPDFGGRASYLQQHGDYQITGWPQAIQNKWIPSNYAQNWGFEDAKLFKFAKNMLTDISKKDTPFNFSMLTSDTHFPNGYTYGDEKKLTNMQYKNVVFHSSTMIAQFIQWCQQQPWYDNTTIVVSGDHLTMDQRYVNSLDKGYDRTVFNLFMNTGLIAETNKNRQFSNMDMFPTTLVALGAQIENEKQQLGLGVNLFSGEQTMIEKYGYQKTKDQIEQRSKFYIKNLIEGKK